MIIVMLKGGLGNQMFQYAFGKHLSIKNNTKLKFDLSYIKKDKLRKYELNNLSINACCAFSIEEKIYSKLNKIHQLVPFYTYISEKNKFFDPKVLKTQRMIIYLDGYWQSEKYFKEIRPTLLKEFENKDRVDNKNLEIYKQIKSENSVAIHIRRTDYVTDKKTKKVHGVCSLRYYNKAIKYVINKLKNPYFFVFSDDIKWAKQNLKISNSTFVDKNNLDEGHKDLRLMKNCKHFIIANSSFSWWGAWLSEYKDKIIIAPKKWFNKKSEGDTIPKRWIRI